MVADTYSYFLNKAKIDPKYFDSSEFHDLAPDFKKVLDSDAGLYKLNQLRKIFANLAMDNGPVSNRKYLLEIAMGMSEQEIKLLLADHRLGSKVEQDAPIMNELRQAQRWIELMADESGLVLHELVITAEAGLMEKQLIGGRIANDKSGIIFHFGRGRLSSMGSELVNLMSLEDDPLDERAIVARLA